MTDYRQEAKEIGVMLGVSAFCLVIFGGPMAVTWPDPQNTPSWAVAIWSFGSLATGLAASEVYGRWLTARKTREELESEVLGQ